MNFLRTIKVGVLCIVMFSTALLIFKQMPKVYTYYEESQTVLNNVIQRVVYATRLDKYKTKSFEASSKTTQLIDHYKSVKNGSLLKLHCNQCVLITSSGHLINSSFGNVIDSYECVIRTNNSPTTKYREDVGMKTTLRVIGFPSRTSSIKSIDNKEIHESERNGVVIVGWGHAAQIGPNKPYGKLLRQTQEKYPLMQIYEFDNIGIEEADKLYANLTGINRLASGTWLSTGFFSILLSRKVCDNLDIYGMVDEYYCDRLRAAKGTDKPYHYYGTSKLGECQHVTASKNSKHGHRFGIEKRLFKQWADEHHNISFKYPEWK